MARNHFSWRSASRFSLVLLLALVLASGCRHTLNSTNIPIPPGWDDQHPGGGGGNNGTPVSITALTIGKQGGGDIHAGDTLNVSVAFTGDISPFALGYVFNGNCVDPASVPTMPRSVTASPDTFSVTLLPTAAAGTCTVDVGIADKDGNIDTASGSFLIVATGGGGGGPTNHNPTITVAADDATCSVMVTVADADGDDLTITQSAPTPLTPLDGTQNVAGGNGSVTFHYVAADILAGGSGTINYTVDDGNGGTASLGGNLFCAGVNLEPDTLYAIPTRDSIAVNSPVTILVATGDPASAFEYMNGVRVTTDSASGFAYADNTFNIGAVGGDADAVDGFWAAMSGIGDGDFLLAPDSFYQVQDAGGGLSGLDFNITPLGGANVDNASGALFNFQATFTTPGTYTLGFQEFNVVDRTFYNDDGQAIIYHWGDVTNNHAGVKNSITVTP